MSDSRKLYEIRNDMWDFASKVEQIEDSDLNDLEKQEALDKLSAEYVDLGDEMTEKIEAVALHMKNTEHTIKACKDEAKRLTERARRLQCNFDWFKQYVLMAMSAGNKDKVEGKLINVTVRKCPPSVTVHDIELLSNEFKVVSEPTVRADSKAILVHFKETGEILSGTTVNTSKRTILIR